MKWRRVAGVSCRRRCLVRPTPELLPTQRGRCCWDDNISPTKISIGGAGNAATAQSICGSRLTEFAQLPQFPQGDQETNWD